MIASSQAGQYDLPAMRSQPSATSPQRQHGCQRLKLSAAARRMLFMQFTSSMSSAGRGANMNRMGSKQWAVAVAVVDTILILPAATAHYLKLPAYFCQLLFNSS